MRAAWDRRKGLLFADVKHSYWINRLDGTLNGVLEIDSSLKLERVDHLVNKLVSLLINLLVVFLSLSFF